MLRLRLTLYEGNTTTTPLALLCNTVARVTSSSHKTKTACMEALRELCTNADVEFTDSAHGHETLLVGGYEEGRLSFINT